MPPRLLKLSAPLIFLALLGLGSEVRAEGRVRQAMRTLMAKVQGTLKGKVTRRQFLGINTMRKAAKQVRGAISELKAEQALMPAAIEIAPKAARAKTSRRPVTKKKAATSTGPDLGRRRVLGFLAAGLVVAAIPKPVQALETRATERFLKNLFGKNAEASEPARKQAPAPKGDKRVQPKDRVGPISPITAGEGRVSSRFSKSRLHPVHGTWRPHTGVDIDTAYGARVGAAQAGKVIYAGPSKGGYGNMVVILHPNGSKTLYAHLSTIPKKFLKGVSWKKRRFVGVAQGEKIGAVGTTGVTTGSVLHFEYRVGASDRVKIDGKPLNPENHVDLAGIRGWRAGK